MNDFKNNFCTLFLIRHAATEWNEAGRLQGQTDTPLSPRGRQQVAELARWFRNSGLQVKAVYSSDLTRAAETAAAVAGVFGLDVKIDPRFRERHLGEAEGKTWDQVVADYGNGVDPALFSLDDLPGVEPRIHVIERMHEGLLEAAAHGQNKAVVVVSHGSALGSWLQWRFRLTQRPRLRNTAIVTVKDFPGFGRVLLP